MLADKLRTSAKVKVKDPVGQQAYTTPGTYQWVCPANVTSVCVVCVGGGGGARNQDDSRGDGGSGGGGALSWVNNIAVSPNESFVIVVGKGGLGKVRANGEDGGDSYISRLDGTVLVSAGGGKGATFAAAIVNGKVTLISFPGIGGAVIVGSGGAGGNAGDRLSNCWFVGGGGGAGGYNGAGGKGGRYDNGVAVAPLAGAGGAGGGGGGGEGHAGAGGGVGIYGQGSNGTAGLSAGSMSATRGGGGSNGGGGGIATSSTNPATVPALKGGLYGGGGGASTYWQRDLYFGDGGNGAVRIIWGENRAFPSTNTGDM